MHGGRENLWVGRHGFLPTTGSTRANPAFSTLIPPPMRADIGVPEKNLQELSNRINVLLADEHVLYVKTRNYHWNITGKSFIEYHEFLEKLYTELAEQIDEIAEEVRTMGHHSVGSMKEFLDLARLLESKQHATGDPLKLLEELKNDHESIVKSTKQDIEKAEELGMATTADFLVDIARYHEKTAWMLRAYLE